MNKHLWVVGLCAVFALNGNAAFAEDLPIWQKMVDTAQKAFDAGKYSKAARNWGKVVDMLKQAAENSKDQILLAGTLKHLGDCHRLRLRWQEAGACYQDSLTAYGKLPADAPDVQTGLTDLSSCYKNILVDSLGDKAAKMLKKVGAVCLSSFKNGDGEHYELALADTYTQVVNEDKVEQVRFNKRICFDFVQTPEGKLNVSKIKGVDVKADVCWVEPRSTIMYLDDKGETTAEVTVDAMGFMKTVTVNPPRQVYDYVLEMVKHVNSPVVASGESPQVAAPTTSAENGVVQSTATEVVAPPVTGVAPTADTQAGETIDDKEKEPQSVSK